MYVCMYVFIGVALCGITHGYGGPIMIVGPMSRPRGTIDTTSHTLDHTCALNVHFLNQLYSGQLRVSCFLM